MEKTEGTKTEYNHVTRPAIAMGGKIYALRMAKRMTQEQLALVLNISPAAISKWECNQSIPDIKMLWALADFFDCSIDDLVGRPPKPLKQLGGYDEEKCRLAMIGEDLLKCSEISRANGLLAMEEAVPSLNGGSKFLAFAIPFIMNMFMRQIDVAMAFSLLENYAAALPAEKQTEGRMVTSVLQKIFSGECKDLIEEWIYSYIGMEYREKKSTMSEILQHSRQEILQKYTKKETYSKHTDLLESFVDLGDFEIQTILRNTDNVTLTAALAGASGTVVTKFLSNLSDRMLDLISEDLDQWQGTEEEILAAQQKLLEMGHFAPPFPGMSTDTTCQKEP